MKQISKDWLSVLTSAISIKAISLFRGLFVAKYLGPETFGILNVVQLISQLNKYGALGFNTIVAREVPYLEARGEFKQVNKVKNNAYSSELLLSVSLLAVGTFSTTFFDNISIKYAVFLATAGLFLAKLAKMHRTELVVEKKFTSLAVINLMAEVVVTLLIIFSVNRFGMHAVLFFTAVGSIFVLLYIRSHIDYKYKFSIDKKELFHQVKIGFPIVLGTLTYGAYRYSERFIIMSFMGMKELGYFALASRFMDSILGIILTRVKVSKIAISESLGANKFIHANRKVIRDTALFFSGIIVLAPGLGYALDLLIPKVLPAYVEAIAILKLIILASAARIIGSFASIVIISPLVNKQNWMAPIQLIATIYIIGASIILNHFGYLDLRTFIIVDIVGYLIYHLGLILTYYIFFYRVFIIKSL